MGSLSSWFRGLKGKLVFASLIPVLGFGILGAVTYANLQSISEQSSDVYDRMLPNTVHIGKAIADKASIGFYLWGAMGTFDSPEDHKQYLQKAEESLKAFSKEIAEYNSLPFKDNEAEVYASVKDHLEQLEPLSLKIIEQIKTGSPDGIQQAFNSLNGGEWYKNSLEIQAGLERIEASITEQSHRNEALLKSEISLINNITLFASLAAIFSTLGTLMWIAHRVSNTVATANDNIHAASSQVTAAIEQLTAAGQDLSHSTTAAAASLQETVASLEEISSMVQMNSDNAKQTATLSFASRDAAEKGEKEIHQLVEHMQEISQSSKKIEEIINVIDDIAFQTNLLALNAAVEAARAGEQGKGFAVVAEAVRALAQRSASAAKDITVLIKDSVEKIEKGTLEAGKSGEMMTEILTSVKKVSDLANEISAASAEQTTGIQQISKAMNQLDHGSQSNAASSEEIASTSEEIASQAMQMQQLIDELGAVITGTTQPAGSPSLKASEPHVVAPKKSAPKAVTPPPKKALTPLKSAQPKLTPVPSASAPAKPKISATAKSSDIIPFDEDDGRGQVGDASGF